MISPLQLQERIDAYTLATTDQEPRKYLGASEIGEKCIRKLWYRFRWCGQEKFDGRMLRLFDRGRREEKEIVKMLRSADLEVHVPDEEGEASFRFDDCSGHFRGTCDGIVLIPDEPGIADDDYAVLEGKTYSTERFKRLKEVHVREADPVYYSQCQTYMGELKLVWALFFAVCKESDESYIEWIPFDQTHFTVCLNKAEQVINADTPPERISNNPDTFSCRYCHYKPICHNNERLHPSNIHCRNCRFSHPAEAGTWVCQKDHTFGTVCEDYHSVCGPAV